MKRDTVKLIVAGVLILGIELWGATSLAVSIAHGQSREDVITLINVAADRHDVDPDAIGRILWCESTWQANVTGPDGSMGIAQYQQITWGWASAGAGWWGASPYNPEAAIDVMAWLLARGEWSHWSACL